MDILGKGLKAYFNGDTNAVFQVRINNQADEEMPVAVFFREFEAMPNTEKHALTLARGRILDVGAAAGCHSLILQEQHNCTSLDISPGAVEIMKMRGVQNPILESFYNYKTDLKFDTIYLLMNGLGIATSVENSARFFAHLKTLLAPNGQIIGDSSDIIYLQESPEDAAMLGQNYYGEVTFEMDFEDETGTPFDWIYFDPKSLELLANANGFDFEMLQEGEHYDYLCRMTMST